VQKSISISMKQIGGTVFAHAPTRQHARAARPAATSNSSEIFTIHVVVRSRLPQVFIDAKHLYNDRA
jgi:hypothetical protein